MDIYSSIISGTEKGAKKFAVLIDPDKNTLSSLKKIIALSNKSGVDFFFFGGSLLTSDSLDRFILFLKENSDIPVILFPGNSLQVNCNADGILLLSLISGRNPDMLIGKHVISAPFLKASKLEILPTGYMLVESGRLTTVAYMSNTVPIPANKPEIAVCTAMAGEMLGLRLIYMDAGSGAQHPIPLEMIRQVRNAVEVPLIIGGGITSAEAVKDAAKAGADIIVAGNAFESKPELIPVLSNAIR